MSASVCVYLCSRCVFVLVCLSLRVSGESVYEVKLVFVSEDVYSHVVRKPLLLTQLTEKHPIVSADHLSLLGRPV